MHYHQNFLYHCFVSLVCEDVSNEAVALFADDNNFEDICPTVTGAVKVNIILLDEVRIYRAGLLEFLLLILAGREDPSISFKCLVSMLIELKL